MRNAKKFYTRNQNNKNEKHPATEKTKPKPKPNPPAVKTVASKAKGKKGRK